MESPQHYTLEELLAEAGWARRLALHLVRDADGADDLLQETWRRALERSPRADGGSSARGWIATVLRNLASNWRRDAELRSFHESRALSPDGSQVEDVETQLKLQRALAEAVLALREPYRTAITLRYLHGLELREIARREDASYEAVRQRISRGLALLRLELEAKRRDDGSSLREFLSAFAVASAKPAWIPALLRKALLVTTKTKLIAAGVAIALLGGAFVWRAAHSNASNVERVEANSTALATNATDPLVATTSKPSDSRSSVASEAPVATAAEKPSTSLTASVVVRAVDENGAPVAASLSLTGMGGAKLAESEPHDGFVGYTFTFQRSDQSEAVALTLEAAGFRNAPCSALVLPGDALDLGVITMTRAAQIAGRVVDANGNPVRGALIECGKGDERIDSTLAPRLGPFEKLRQATRTSADGEFELQSVDPGPLRIWAGAPGMRFAFTDVIDAEAGRAIERVELKLEPYAPQDAFEILVRTPDGSPCTTATIECVMHLVDPKAEYRGGDPLRAKVDAHGRAFMPTQFDGTYDLIARDLSGQFGLAERAGLSPGTTPIELRLTNRVKRTLRVRDEHSAPVETFGASVRDMFDGSLESTRHSGLDLAAQYANAVHAGGELDFSAPETPFTLDVDAPGYELAKLGPFDARTIAGPIEATLTRLAVVSGRVLLDGAPVANADVGLSAAANPEQVISINGVRCHAQHSSTVRTQSDSNGRFELRLRDAGRFFVQASKPGLASAELGPREFGPHQGADDLVLTLSHGGAIEGRVLVGKDESAAILLLASRGDGQFAMRRADREGKFRFDALTPGRWLVERSPPQFEWFGWQTAPLSVDADYELPSNCNVREHETTELDLDLSAQVVQRVRGRLQIHDRGLGRWRAYLEPQRYRNGRSDAVVVEATLDQDGRFECDAGLSGDQTLNLDGATASGSSWTIRQELTRWSGVIDWQLELRVGAVHVHSINSLAASASAASLSWTNSDCVSIRVRADALDEHDLSIRTAPVGACRLTTWKDSAELELARFEVKEGKTTEVEIP